MVSEMGRGTGGIRSATEEQGLTENTLVFFISDNGGLERLGADNGLLRGGKGSPWEGGIRVPAALAWLSKVDPGKTLGAPFVLEDLLLTLLAAVGVEAEFPKPIDGRNVRGAFGRAEPIPEQPRILAS